MHASGQLGMPEHGEGGFVAVPGAPGHLTTRRPVSIRVRAPSDEAFLRELGQAGFSEYETNAGRSTLAMATRGMTLVATAGARRLGFVVLQENRDRSFHLSAIAVLEDARGAGVGRALLKSAEAFARSRGAPRMELVTADSNLPALELFLRSGFQRSRRLSGTYGRGQRNLMLEKAL